MANIEIYTKAACPVLSPCESAAEQQEAWRSELPIDGDAIKKRW